MAHLWIDLLNIHLIHNANMDGKAFWGDGTPFMEKPYMSGFDNNGPNTCFRYVLLFSYLLVTVSI